MWCKYFLTSEIANERLIILSEETEYLKWDLQKGGLAESFSKDPHPKALNA